MATTKVKPKKTTKATAKARINCYVDQTNKKKLMQMCDVLDRSENYLLNKALDEYITNHFDKTMEYLK